LLGEPPGIALAARSEASEASGTRREHKPWRRGCLAHLLPGSAMRAHPGLLMALETLRLGFFLRNQSLPEVLKVV
jgi:hypothetical protein